MDLQLSRTGDYAVRAATSLARHYNGGYRKAREVTEDMALPPRFTPQVLLMLMRAGLVEAKAGRTGGYRLSRPPEEISLLAVVEAAEGPLRTERCTLRGGPCRWEDACPVHSAWAVAGDALRESLAAATLASLAREDPLSNQRGPG